MKRISCSITTIILICCMIISPANADSLTFSSIFNIATDEFAAFQAAHPGLDIKESAIYYQNSGELIGSLVTREFDDDVLYLYGSLYDTQLLMEKGYLLDLSSNATIEALVRQMYPSIRNQLTYNNHIYAIPDTIRFEYSTIDLNTWEQAGLTSRALPTSFEEFLDFIEYWCDRIENEPEPNIRIISSWDADTYNQSSYTSVLTEMLITYHIAQLEYAGSSIRFNDKTFASLLARVKNIGQRIYELEGPVDSLASGIEHQFLWRSSSPSFPTDMENVISMRLTNTQPQIIKANLDVRAAYAGTSLPSEAIDFLERSLLGSYRNEFLVSSPIYYFYLNSKPVIRGGWEEEVANVQNRILQIETQLQDDNNSLDSREELEDQLISRQNRLIELQSDSYKYEYSPAQFESYNAHVDDLYFARPNVFTPGTDGYSNLKSLIDRFSAGLLPTSQFLSELDNLAWMLEMENE